MRLQVSFYYSWTCQLIAMPLEQNLRFWKKWRKMRFAFWGFWKFKNHENRWKLCENRKNRVFEEFENRNGKFSEKSVLKRVNFGVFYVIGLDGKCLIRYWEKMVNIDISEGRFWREISGIFMKNGHFWGKMWIWRRRLKLIWGCYQVAARYHQVTK